MKEQLQVEGIRKEEKVGYLKTKLNLKQGVLYLTSKRIVLEIDKGIFSAFGLVGVLLGTVFGKKVKEFDIELKNITHIVEGKHGFARNVLEITDSDNKTYRLMVKNYNDWEKELNSRL